MAIETADPHIEKVSGHPARLVKNPRIRIAQLVMDYPAHGWSAGEMCRQHEYLSPSEAHAALHYYRDHRDEADGEIREELEHHERERARTPPSALATRLRRQARVDR